MDKRPILDEKISLIDFKDFYWLKEELVQFCRHVGLKRSGGKLEISKRIEHFLTTGSRENPGEKKSQKVRSKFDWHVENLTEETKITDSYKNTDNVRRYFVDKIGPHFKFNIKFMKWMKENSGSTLNTAEKEWRKIKSAAKEPKNIAPQFEYNTYLRDFLKENPGFDRAIGIHLWKMKKSMRGDNKYRKSDLEMLKSK